MSDDLSTWTAEELVSSFSRHTVFLNRGYGTRVDIQHLIELREEILRRMNNPTLEGHAHE